VEHLEHLKITRNFNPVTVIPGSGNCLRGGGIPGDLVISLNLEKTPSQTLRVEGKNIRGIIRISPAQAVLGDTLTLNVFGTTEKITIPAGTRPGAIIEKKEAGIAKGKTKGSLILKVYFNIPKKLSDTEKGLYKQLLKLQKE
jgi:DnaJ-class molecular chaperone